MQLRIRQEQGNPPPSAMDISFFISGPVCSRHLFLSGNSDLICKHLNIDKAAAADCFALSELSALYLDRSLFLRRSSFFSPWLSIYCRIVSIVTPPALSRPKDLTPECIFHGLTPLYLSSFFLYRRICIYELIVLFSILHQGRENKCFFYTIEIFLSRYAQMCNSSHHLKRWENSCYIC